MNDRGDFDAIVVGAGPAGTTAALTLAQKGRRVALLERGESPGSKNMFGGMMAYCPTPERLLPDFWEQAPWERAVTKRVLTVVGEASSTSVTFHADASAERALTGFTLYRPLFDRWYAQQAEKQGVTLLCGCRVAGLLVRDGAVRGVNLGSPGDDLEAPIIIACDGTLSLLAQEAGLHAGFKPSQLALGIRALYRLSEAEIDDRFGLTGRERATHEVLGCTDGIRGGGYVYTQTETLSVGLVMHLDSLKQRGLAPYDLLDRFVASPAVAPLLRGSRLVEYSAHLLPEGGIGMVPRLSTAGLLLAGDAAGLCYTNGLNQEGMNLAMTSGMIAAEVTDEALTAADLSAARLGAYQERLKQSFVLRDMTTFRRAVDFMHHDRLFEAYPRVVGTLMEKIYRSDGQPKQKIGKLGREALRDVLPLRRVIGDLIEGGRAFLW